MACFSIKPVRWRDQKEDRLILAAKESPPNLKLDFEVESSPSHDPVSSASPLGSVENEVSWPPGVSTSTGGDEDDDDGATSPLGGNSYTFFVLPPFKKSRNALPQSTVTRSLGSFLLMTTRRPVPTKD